MTERGKHKKDRPRPVFEDDEIDDLPIRTRVTHDEMDEYEEWRSERRRRGRKQRSRDHRNRRGGRDVELD